MTTITIGDTKTAKIPDGVQFAFGSIPIVVTWSSGYAVRYIKVNLQDASGRVYETQRTPFMDGSVNKVFFELSAYVRASMADVSPFAGVALSNMVRQFTYSILIAYQNNSYASSGYYTFNAVWGSIGVGEVFNEDTIFTYFPNGSSTLRAFMAGTTTVAYKERNQFGTLVTLGTTTYNYTGIVNFPINYGGRAADVVELTSTTAIKYTLDPEDGVVPVTWSDYNNRKKIIAIKKQAGCAGVLLQWVDTQGLGRTWLFRAGKRQYNVQNETTAKRMGMDYGPINGYNGEGLIIEDKNAVPRQEIGYASATPEEIAVLRTLLASPIVEAQNDNDVGFRRVTIATGSTTFTKANMQQFTATIIYPAMEVQYL